MGEVSKEGKVLIKKLGLKNAGVKISDNASFSLQLFIFVHVPPVFSVLLTIFAVYQQPTFFDPPCMSLSPCVYIS